MSRRVCASSRPRASNTPARAVMRGSSKRRRRRRRWRNHSPAKGCSRMSWSRNMSTTCFSTAWNGSFFQGVDLSCTTLCGWVADVATALTPIGDELRLLVTTATYLQTDDTPVTILERSGGSRKGRLWTYLDPIGGQVVFDATPTHERDGPEASLASFAGDLQADAYAGYDALYATSRMREIGCWAHARRGFVEALTTDVRAALTVALIQQLYDVQRAGTDLSPDARQRLRQTQSVPLLAKTATERDQLACTVLPKSPLGDALRYLTNQWAALQRFVDDGRLAIDNNRAENQLRVVALGRKNWLFAGSFE